MWVAVRRPRCAQVDPGERDEFERVEVAEVGRGEAEGASDLVAADDRSRQGVAGLEPVVGFFD